jgi:nitroimidazol reductase NimA-like FMN-containing flavoprotein (pyridoxamine 5'-phosphate oxidase superfamily)
MLMNKDPAAREILENIGYMAIASVSSDGKPWNTPVYFACDEGFNLYWVSAEESCHSANIATNPAIFISIYDSTAPEGSAIGLYIEATACELEDAAQIRKACESLYRRARRIPPPETEFMGRSPRRIYRAIPRQAWTNSVRWIEGTRVDVREAIDLA